MENRFTSDRIVDGKRRRVIVDVKGNIVNRNLSREELAFFCKSNDGKK